MSTRTSHEVHDGRPTRGARRPLSRSQAGRAPASAATAGRGPVRDRRVDDLDVHVRPVRRRRPPVDLRAEGEQPWRVADDGLTRDDAVADATRRDPRRAGTLTSQSGRSSGATTRNWSRVPAVQHVRARPARTVPVTGREDRGAWGRPRCRPRPRRSVPRPREGIVVHSTDDGSTGLLGQRAVVGGLVQPDDLDAGRGQVHERDRDRPSPTAHPSSAASGSRRRRGRSPPSAARVRTDQLERRARRSPSAGGCGRARRPRSAGWSYRTGQPSTGRATAPATSARRA